MSDRQPPTESSVLTTSSSATQNPSHGKQPCASLWKLWSVVLAGEAIFVLPFLLPRLFRPTMLEVWGLTNVEFGLAFSAYGIVAMVSYFFGGLLADRFDPRRLMTLALIATAAVAVGFIGVPSTLQLQVIYGFFGMTTILLFWSAMIRVTHALGGTATQGTAFGILDAGRGLFAAVLASVLFMVFAWLRDTGAEDAPANGMFALRSMVAIAAVTVAACAGLVHVSLRDVPLRDVPLRPIRTKPAKADGETASANTAEAKESFQWRYLVSVASRPGIWLQGLIVLCAYCGYKSIDHYGIYARDVFLASEVEASRLSTLVFWARPVAAVVAGMAADRLGHFCMLGILFAAAAVGNFILALAGPIGSNSLLLLTGLGLTVSCTAAAAAVYGMRGVYFAVFHDMDVPSASIGTAAGLVSAIGFLPDVFFGVIAGYVVDRNPGAAGHRLVFGSVALLAIVGLVASIFNRIISRRQRPAGG